MHLFLLLGEFDAGRATGFAFAVQGLGSGGGATHSGEVEDFNLEEASFIADAQGVADADFAGGFGFVVVGFDASEFAGSHGEGAGFEEAGCPEPFVDAETGHRFILNYSRWWKSPRLWTRRGASSSFVRGLRGRMLGSEFYDAQVGTDQMGVVFR